MAVETGHSCLRWTVRSAGSAAFQNSASAVDLGRTNRCRRRESTVAPIENLKAALRTRAFRQSTCDRHGRTADRPHGRADVRPKAYLPVHWDGLWGAFQSGVEKPYADASLDAFLTQSGIALLSDSAQWTSGGSTVRCESPSTIHR